LFSDLLSSTEISSSHFMKKLFSSKYQNFVGYRISYFAKSDEKLSFKISDFFYMRTFTLMSGSVTRSSIGNSPTVTEEMASKVGELPILNHREAAHFLQNISRNTQPGTMPISSLYFSNRFRSINIHYC
ncbi:hypothetical protein T10_6860, partial [Trichinella papuae]